MDGNAWDLVEEADHEGAVSELDFRRSRSPSNLSRLEGDRLLGLDGTEIDTEALSIMASAYDQDRRERSQRSKSPAVESLRKVSRVILEKVGIRSKKRDDAVLLRKVPDLETLALEGICERPTQTHYGEKAASSGFLPKILSSALLKDRKKAPADSKCSYLFQSTDDIYIDFDSRPQERIHVYDPYCPVHGSRRRLKRQQLVDMHSFVTSVETADNETLSPILYSQAYIAKVLRKRRRAILTGAEKMHVDKTKRKIKVNLAIISVAFLFLFTAFNAMQNLQTSINGNLGADSLFALYLSLAISSLFVPSFVLNRLGSKNTLIASFCLYILYMFANFLPEYYCLLPVSILTGIGGSCLWAAKCVYITESGIKYAKLNVEAQTVVIVRFFGYFFMILHLGQVAGNLLTSFILTNLFGLATESEDFVDHSCGHSFVENVTVLSVRAIKNLERPPPEAFQSIIIVNFCCSVVALLIVFCFLNALRRDESTKTKAPYFSCDVLRLTGQNLQRPKTLLLVPLTVFNGIEQAFAVGLYTKAYVGCGLGIGSIGYVMTAFGVADAVCSLVFGPLIKLFGRMPLFVFGAVINSLMLLCLLIWPLNPSDEALFYVVAGVWGMADGVWNTQINGLWVALVSRHSLEVSFANYRFWISMGLAIGFLLMRFMSVWTYLIVALAVLIIGISGYLIIESYEFLATYFKQLFEACFVMCGVERASVAETPLSGEETSEGDDDDDEETEEYSDAPETVEVNASASQRRSLAASVHARNQ